MGVVLRNEEVVGGLDAAVAAKIGTATLTTAAQNLSGAVNELDAELGNETLPDPSKTVKGNINSIEQSLSYKTESNLFIINSAFSSIFKITNQSAYRVGNILYFYLELHRIGNITVGEHDIAQVSVTPKIPCTAIPFSNDYSMLVQTSKNVKLSTNSTGRAWYTLTGYILEN